MLYSLSSVLFKILYKIQTDKKIATIASLLVFFTKLNNMKELQKKNNFSRRAFNASRIDGAEVLRRIKISPGESLTIFGRLAALSVNFIISGETSAAHLASSIGNRSIKS